ncbi:hypothetical protein LCGC14_2130290, partial [marine sediment metagenome]
TSQDDIPSFQKLKLSFKNGKAVINPTKYTWRDSPKIELVPGIYTGAYNRAYRESVKYPFYKKYTRIVYRMYAKHKDKDNDTIKRGWHIYVDRPRSARRLQIKLRSKSKMMLDWIRLVKVSDSTNVPIKWFDSRNDDRLSHHIEFYVDTDNSGHDGKLFDKPIVARRTKQPYLISKYGINNYDLNLAGLQPGKKYYIYVAKCNYYEDAQWRRWCNYQYSNYSAPITINRGPYIKVTSPNEKGSGDWARKYLGRSWSFNRRSDVINLKHIRSVRFRRGIFTGVSKNKDPHFSLQQSGKLIDTRKYYRLTFRYHYKGDFSLRRGSMLRIGWYSDKYSWQMSDDVVTYPGWHTYTVDLRKIKTNRGRVGWKGLVKGLRIDPNEDAYGPRRFYFSKIRLASDNTLRSSYKIRFNLNAGRKKRSKVRLYYDRDRKFGNGNERLIKRGTYRNGKRSYTWRPSRRIKGNVYIYARATDGINTNGNYSTGYIKVH